MILSWLDQAETDCNRVFGFLDTTINGVGADYAKSNKSISKEASFL